MNEEEIRGYLNRIDELEQRLKGKDKKTLQWLIFGYNECAKLLNERKQENKQQKEIIDKAIDLLGNYKHYSTPDEKQNSDNEYLVDRAYDILKEV